MKRHQCIHCWRKRMAFTSLLTCILFLVIDIGVSMPIFYFMKMDAFLMIALTGFVNGFFAFQLASIVVNSLEKSFRCPMASGIIDEYIQK